MSITPAASGSGNRQPLPRPQRLPEREGPPDGQGGKVPDGWPRSGTSWPCSAAVATGPRWDTATASPCWGTGQAPMDSRSGRHHAKAGRCAWLAIHEKTPTSAHHKRGAGTAPRTTTRAGHDAGRALRMAQGQRHPGYFLCDVPRAVTASLP